MSDRGVSAMQFITRKYNPFKFNNALSLTFGKSRLGYLWTLLGLVIFTDCSTDSPLCTGCQDFAVKIATQQ